MRFKMPYSTKKKPKILRTFLTEEIHSEFKILCVRLKITMAHLMEDMITERIEKERWLDARKLQNM
jgi:hypothetical protein